MLLLLLCSLSISRARSVSVTDPVLLLLYLPCMLLAVHHVNNALFALWNLGRLISAVGGVTVTLLSHHSILGRSSTLLGPSQSPVALGRDAALASVQAAAGKVKAAPRRANSTEARRT